MLAAGGACGQAALIRTSTLNALGEAVAQYAQLVDIGPRRAAAPPIPLPGPQALGAFLPLPDTMAIVSAGAPLDRTGQLTEGHGTVLQGVIGIPFGAPRALRAVSDPGWRDVPAAVFAAPVSGVAGVISLGHSLRGEARLGYTVFDDAGGLTAPTHWPLPGEPVAAAVIERLGRAAVLCAGPGGASILHIRDVLTGQVILADMALESAAGAPLGDQPVALAAAADGVRLYALTLGYDALGGAPALRLHALDAADGRSLAPAVVVAGTAAPGERALYPVGAGAYVLSRARPSEDVHIRRYDFTSEGWRIALEHSMPGAGALPLFAAQPDGPGIALAAGRRLERMPTGAPEGLVSEFDDPIGALAWADRSILVGEGPRLRVIGFRNGVESAAFAFQSGVVSAIAAFSPGSLSAGDIDGDGLPSVEEALRGSDPFLFDTDGDGLGDGADAALLEPAPRLEAPPYIVLRGDAAGHEIRALLFEPPTPGGSVWRIAYDRAAAPWLAVSPLAGAAPGVAYMGVDRIAYGAPASLLRQTITVSLESPEGAVHDTAEIDIRVAPAASPVRRIAWLDEDTFPPSARIDDPESAFARLAALLAAPPHHFSHVPGAEAEWSAPGAETAVAVITAGYAAQGLVTRQALLDFAARGGGLLFLTDGDAGADGGALARWLEPAGIRMRPADATAGTFGPGAPHLPAARWRQFDISAAWSIETQAPAAPWVPVSLGSSESVAAGAPYGLGRIAAVPGELLTNPTDDGRTAFVTELFEWLSRARREVSDLDGDGVPDTAEDRNGNGVVDPGESDPLRPDTDGDGIPDGDEDRNRNGVQDPGETSAVNVDTDGDGVYDGADSNPLPPREAPVIERIHPASGPAQGGAHVMLQGRNFAPNAEVWFGDRRAVRVQFLGPEAIIGEAPAAASPAGGAVDIAALNPSVGLRGTLPQAFTYTPLTRVLLSLHENRRGDGGAVAIRITAPTGVAVGRIALRLEADAPVLWDRAAPGAMASFDGRSVVTGAAPEGGLWVNLSDSAKHHGSGEIAVVRWTSESASGGGSPRFAIGWAQVLAPNGAALDVEIAAE